MAQVRAFSNDFQVQQRSQQYALDRCESKGLFNIKHMSPFSNFPLVTGIKDKVEALLAIGKGFRHTPDCALVTLLI